MWKDIEKNACIIIKIYKNVLVFITAFKNKEPDSASKHLGILVMSVCCFLSGCLVFARISFVSEINFYN